MTTVNQRMSVEEIKRVVAQRVANTIEEIERVVAQRVANAIEAIAIYEAKTNLTPLLNDLSYILPNNEHNEPTQGDIGETSNKLTQATRNEFEELYASANEELYPGCDYVTQLDFMAKFTYFKVKGVKLPDGFGSCFKHKVTDKDTNITGLKSHDCHIMMQRLLPYGLQQYLPDKIAKPIIELCSLFKQICSTTLMTDDMLKAQIKVVDILCDLKFIYHPALFDIMIHLVIHLPLEDLEGGPIRPQWMFPFERYIKKLKGYVRNKAKPEELKKVKWYVLHNIPEMDTYRSQFKSLFPKKDMKEEFPDCRDECRTTQNSGICSPGPNAEMYYGQLQEILKFKYLLFKVVLFQVKWFDTRNQGRKVKCLVLRNNMTQIDCRGEAFKNDKYILVIEVKQVFYLEDKAKSHWKVVEHVNHKKFSNGGVIMVEDDPDIIYFDNSSDLPLSASLNDLDNVTLHIDGQSTEVDAAPDIIDVPDKDDDIIDDKDALPYDLANFDDEDLISVDDDSVDKMSVDVTRSYGSDGGGVDRPPPHHVPTGCEGKEIDAGIQQHLQKAYNTNKAAFKAQHWVIDPETETYNVEKIRQARPEGITVEELDKYMSHPQIGPGRNTCPKA
nr:hypothetical protein [Tanacetum cinerariifolium]